jgi:RNA recognition motif-containing protein
MPVESSIRGAFLGFGAIKSISVIPNKGFAFVEFEEGSAATKAVNHNIQDIAGTPILVKWSKRKTRSNGPSSSSSSSSSSFGAGGRKRAKNVVIAAALKPETWQGPALAEGFEVPPVPSSLRAFIAPDKTNVPLPVMFPIPTFEQAKKLYPSLKYSRQIE